MAVAVLMVIYCDAETNPPRPAGKWIFRRGPLDSHNENQLSHHYLEANRESCRSVSPSARIRSVPASAGRSTLDSKALSTSRSFSGLRWRSIQPSPDDFPGEVRHPQRIPQTRRPHLEHDDQAYWLRRNECSTHRHRYHHKSICTACTSQARRFTRHFLKTND